MVVEGGFTGAHQVEMVGCFLPGPPPAPVIQLPAAFGGGWSETELEERSGWTRGRTNLSWAAGSAHGRVRWTA